MRKVTRLALWLFLTGALTAQSASGQHQVAAELNRIYREYTTQRENPNVADLVRLNQQLRALFPHNSWESRPPVEAEYYKSEYESLGISQALFDSDFLTYSGKLLREAHALNPNSPYRSYTLYSTVFEHGEEDSVPSPEAAQAYVREFPSGPFIVHAYAALAYFYDDLYKVIQLEEAGARVNYKYDCYQAYISSAPLEEQRLTVQQAGIRNYERLLERLHGNKSEEQDLRELREGNNLYRWFYCAD